LVEGDLVEEALQIELEGQQRVELELAVAEKQEQGHLGKLLWAREDTSLA
jgi:hypothetical protein